MSIYEGFDPSQVPEPFGNRHDPKYTNSDLVERLREKIVDTLLAGLPYNRDGDEAADRIEALEAENARLREALGLLSAVELTIPADRIRDDDHVIITYKTFRTLRTALERIDHD